VEERANRSEFLLRAFPTQTKSHLLRDMKRKGSSLQCSPYSYCGILEDKEEKRGWLLIYCYHSANNYSRPELQAALRETSHISLHRTKCGTSLQWEGEAESSRWRCESCHGYRFNPKRGKTLILKLQRTGKLKDRDLLRWKSHLQLYNWPCNKYTMEVCN